MDLEGKGFGRGYFMESGHRELGGARDLINQYKLWPFYEIFCKRSLPLSISETPYLRNVVGDTNIKKGEGMELGQLCQNTYVSEKKARLRPFELDVLSEAFHMKKGLPSAVPKSENQSREKEAKIKKIKDVNRKDEKYKEHKLHQVTDGIANNRIKHHDSHTLQLKNRQEKKRKAETSNDPSVSKRVNMRQ